MLKLKILWSEKVKKKSRVPLNVKKAAVNGKKLLSSVTQEYINSTIKSQYIFCRLLFVAKNTDLYESNSQIRNINT